ncbi:MAG: EF-P lysine aminoacylase EpmA [Steroidobacteraceae bacterium]
MAETYPPWHCGISRERLRQRADALARAREFFRARSIMEVDTPIVVGNAVTDANIESAAVVTPGGRSFLHTSPEYAMKRLLAGGSGDIYQICHVVRDGESGRHHNREFTMVEWYRRDHTMEAMARETAAFVTYLLARDLPVRLLSYRDAFGQFLQFDPRGAGVDEWRELALRRGARAELAGELDAAGIGDLLFGQFIAPQLGRGEICVLHRYPATQAALARTDPRDPEVALRFELILEGLELANGFEELADAREQRQRFERDLAMRRERGQPAHALDERLLEAIAAGIGQCSGVAVGFDRVLMLATRCERIDEVLPFAGARA